MESLNTRGGAYEIDPEVGKFWRDWLETSIGYKDYKPRLNQTERSSAKSPPADILSS